MRLRCKSKVVTRSDWPMPLPRKVCLGQIVGLGRPSPHLQLEGDSKFYIQALLEERRLPMLEGVKT